MVAYPTLFCGTRGSGVRGTHYSSDVSSLAQGVEKREDTKKGGKGKGSNAIVG